MRLSDWRRIGAVLTLLWCVVGGFLIANRLEDNAKTALISEHKRCVAARIPANGDRGSNCGEKFSADWKRNLEDRWRERVAFTLAYTLIPIPIIWLIVYGVISTVRRVWSAPLDKS